MSNIKEVLRSLGLNQKCLKQLSNVCVNHPRKGIVITQELTGKDIVDPIFYKLSESKKIIAVLKTLSLYTIILANNDKDKWLFISRKVNGEIITTTIPKTINNVHITLLEATTLALKDILGKTLGNSTFANSIIEGEFISEDVLETNKDFINESMKNMQAGKYTTSPDLEALKIELLKTIQKNQSAEEVK